MKSGIGKLGLGIGLALLLLGPSGLAEKPPPTLTEIAVVTERDSTNVNDDKLVETKVAESTNAIAITDAPTNPITEEKALPPNIHPARPLAEIIKLANSGVEEHVMMAYVTNSTRTFNLNAEEIIYLKDIGVPDRVVTAMILRDQTLRVDSMTALAAATPPPPSEPPVAPDA